MKDSTRNRATIQPFSRPMQKLTAAGELQHPLVRTCQFDVEALDLFLCRAVSGFRPQDAAAGEGVDAGEQDVVPDAEVSDHGLAPAVLGNEDHAAADGFLRCQAGTLFAVQQDSAC